MTLVHVLQNATGQLRDVGVSDPIRDARILLAHALQVDYKDLPLATNEDLLPDTIQRYDTLIKQRAKRIPVSHLIEMREFYGRTFRINSKVFDPRPETEILVSAALTNSFQRVLDLGIGSGNIILTLLAEQLVASGIGVDICKDACYQAKLNALFHQVEQRIDIRQSNWFNNIDGQFDLIVSNPPYIAKEEMPSLSEEVRLHEPEQALTDGRDGLSAYANICRNVRKHLTLGGRLIFEVSPHKCMEVCKIVYEAGFDQVIIRSDLEKRPRVVIANLDR
ncbi:MAG: peptide chain release factor N(5)-glutamine methyltransferase [Aestuariivita sp.]|nr:peptide chain release factor N(5)-glutamine methyltransferase [Aestuariivita sp.]